MERRYEREGTSKGLKMWLIDTQTRKADIRDGDRRQSR